VLVVTETEPPAPLFAPFAFKDSAVAVAVGANEVVEMLIVPPARAEVPSAFAFIVPPAKANVPPVPTLVKVILPPAPLAVAEADTSEPEVKSKPPGYL